ncbi:SagB/ThcOx family dehydrogenase [Desulfovermiculus halophilus]|uniref:SagB/ThcOx family dehydrogenase n=1 Tax=Desulfovermiculus halophilus TaxID=339722 RepID=UPI000557439D|nr:SagB/ThcOx family dehydrogenase [Desulfovermiculus halophilus]
MSDLQSCLGTTYLHQTEYDREQIATMSRPHIRPAPLYKVYPQAPTVSLPQPVDPGGQLWEALSSRRSRRRYAHHDVSLEALSALLWASQGISGQAGRLSLRTAPSAGALYPVETYVQVNKVQGLEPGLYHLNIKDWCLETLDSGSFGPQLAQICLDQRFMAQAAVNVCWSAVLRRNMAKYGHRGMRYIFMDLGHICQNLLLAAEGFGLSACPVGAYFDGEANELFGLDGKEESMLYFASVGHPDDGGRGCEAAKR